MEITIATDQKIINSLLLNASFIDNLGLMHGKMGISILFYHLARKHNNKIYEEYAGELIDEIYEEITSNTPVDFENGLAGIGWGIEYLVQEGFIEADTDEVLEEFDNWIFKELTYNTPNELGILNGLLGIGQYYLNRIQKKGEASEQNIALITNKQTLVYLIDEIVRRVQNFSNLINEPGITSKIETKYNQQSNVINDNENLLNFKNTPFFSLTWDYTSLIWFLAEMIEKKIMNYKVEKIIIQLITPLSDISSLPKLQLNRLILLATLLRLKMAFHIISDITISSNIENIIDTLKQEIDSTQIHSELPTDDLSLQSGISGIILLFEKLQYFLGSDFLNQETDYCRNILFQSVGNNSDAIIGSYKENINEFGILTGISGPLLITSLVE